MLRSASRAAGGSACARPRIPGTTPDRLGAGSRSARKHHSPRVRRRRVRRPAASHPSGSSLAEVIAELGRMAGRSWITSDRFTAGRAVMVLASVDPSAVAAHPPDPGLAEFPQRLLLTQRVLQRSQLGVSFGCVGDLCRQQVRPVLAEAPQLNGEPTDVPELDLPQPAQVSSSAPNPAPAAEVRLGRARLGWAGRRLGRDRRGLMATTGSGSAAGGSLGGLLGSSSSRTNPWCSMVGDSSPIGAGSSESSKRRLVLGDLDRVGVRSRDRRRVRLGSLDRVGFGLGSLDRVGSVSGVSIASGSSRES